MKIGSLKLETPLVMAPMAGITNAAFRLIVRRLGAALVCSEMVSANGLTRRSWKTEELMNSLPGEAPLSVQVFGAIPEVVAEAAAMAEQGGADVVDLNMGCSVRKVLKTGSGSALMKDPERAGKMFALMRRAVDGPLTVKIRSGWDRSGEDALLIGRLAQDAGFDAVALHPRTAAQGFSGTADWSLIKRLVDELSIPVIGNGDVKTARDVIRMREETGCELVMIGRAAQVNPWIFSQARNLLEGRPPGGPEPAMRKALMRDYAALCVDSLGEVRACRMLRSRLAWLSKSLPGAKAFRESIKNVETLEEVNGKIGAWFAARSLPDQSAETQ